MRRFLLWIGIVPGLVASVHAAQESRVYGIFIQGSLAGWETVVEDRDPKGNRVFESEHELHLPEGTDARRAAFVTALRLHKESLAPLHYSCRYTSGESGDYYEVQSDGGTLTRRLSRAGHTSEASVANRAGILLLDLNVYHHFEFFVRKYDSKKGGRQVFPAFIPLIGGELPVALTRLADSNLEHARGIMPVHNYRVEVLGTWAGTLATDRQGGMARLQVRERDPEVLRRDLLPEGLALPSANKESPDPPEARPPLISFAVAWEAWIGDRGSTLESARDIAGMTPSRLGA